ncbi:hypothetical protein Vi05172_g5467 [Venturia inaequalis]|nr:hypothetical protein Vi05172_g5467 [Venturia inaequalis]
MAVAKRTVVSVLSALYLLFLTLLAAYTMHLSRLHSLPLPRALSAFTLALPLITGLLISSITTLPSSQPLLLKPNGNKSASHQPQQWQNYTLLLLTILSTVLATLNGTYLPSSPTQTCALDTKWQSLFSRHNGKAIQRIQDAFECCGLHSVVDKAFPFPSKNVGVDACSKTFRRTQSCFNDWRGEEQRVAGLGLVVILGAVLWEILILTLFKSKSSTWWSHIPGASGTNDPENQINGRRVLSLGDGGASETDDGEARGRYLDHAGVTEHLDDSANGGGDDTAPLHSRVQPSQLRGEAAEWAGERRE